MKEVKLLIPEGQRIGEAIENALEKRCKKKKLVRVVDTLLYFIEDQDLLELLSKLLPQPK